MFDKKHRIKLYGIKYIKPALGRGFIYEAIVFDDYPKDKKSYTILVGNTSQDVRITQISDTCIRFCLQTH